MKQATQPQLHPLNKENFKNAINRRGRDSIGSQNDEGHLISKLIPDFGLVALTRNISEMLDLPERTDLKGNDGDGSCDIFSSNVIDVVKDLGLEVKQTAQEITVKTAQDISKTAQDISKTARAIIPLPASITSTNPNPTPTLPDVAATTGVKVKAPRNYNVNFIFTEVERSREEEFLDLTVDEPEAAAGEDALTDHEAASSEPSIPPDFQTPTKTYEQQDMFHLMYTPATCYSQSSRCDSIGKSEVSLLDQSSSSSCFLDQSVVVSPCEKSVHSLEDSPLKLSEEEEEEVEDACDLNEESECVDETDGNEVDEESGEVCDEENLSSVVVEQHQQDFPSNNIVATSTAEATASLAIPDPSPQLDAMDLLLQTLFDGEVTPLVCGSFSGESAVLGSSSCAPAADSE